MKTFKTLVAAAAVGALLSACGGGGDDGPQPAAVGSASASVARYGQPVIFTVNGSNLDQGLSATAGACNDFSLSTTPPFVSSATTAYIRCTVDRVGQHSLNVLRSSDGALLATVQFNVEVPQVTMTFGGAVNGSLVVTLEPQRAPITVANFLSYVNSGFYTNTVIHRHAPNFVLQGGGYSAPLSSAGNLPLEKLAGAPIRLETTPNGLSNLRYTLSMARESEPNTATTQFFINLVNNSADLDYRTPAAPGYAVFGSITAGIPVITAMTTATCSLWPAFFGRGSTNCLPEPNIVITSATQTR